MSQEMRITIGQRIRQARENRNITQQELADLLGKTQNTIASYETGARVIQTVELPALAQTLGVPIAYLFGEEFQVEEAHSILIALTPPFQLGAVIFLRELMGLQNQLLNAIENISGDALEEAGKMVEQHQLETANEIKRVFTEEMMSRVFGKGKGADGE